MKVADINDKVGHGCGGGIQHIHIFFWVVTPRSLTGKCFSEILVPIYQTTF
jgi:hypothetical protein